MRAVARPVDSQPLSQPQAAEGRSLSFANLRRIANANVFATDALIAVVLLAAFTGGVLVPDRQLRWNFALVQVVLIAPLAWRRTYPTLVFCVVAMGGLLQWWLGYRLVADVSLLVALYTVAVHETRVRSLLALGVMEVGVGLASTKWDPAGTVERSAMFLTATVVAALFAGYTVRSGSEYVGWLAERAHRLEIERDQQSFLSAAAERDRIAREMHDIVAHSLSVVVTLADAASATLRSNPEKSGEAMDHVSSVGRQALKDMRALIGVLRTEDAGVELTPTPSLSELDDLFDRVRATGLEVDVAQTGDCFQMSRALELTTYRIVQEALTNTLKHAKATKANVSLGYRWPAVTLEIKDDGRASATRAASEPAGNGGHGIPGMRERAGLHAGTLSAGPFDGGGWLVRATLFEAGEASEAGGAGEAGRAGGSYS